MKYSIDYYRNLKEKAIMDKVDEVMFSYNADVKEMEEMVLAFPDKQFVRIIDFTPSEEVYSFIKHFKDNFTVAVRKNTFVSSFAERMHLDGIRYYFVDPARTFDDARRYKLLQVSQLVVAGELFFNMEKLKRFELEIRVDPTDIYDDSEIPGMPERATGSWIRPEDVDMYEGFVDTLDFSNTAPERTEALIRIYRDEKAWSGPLSMLVPGLHSNVPVNRMLNSELTALRLNCGRRCRIPGTKCSVCSRQFSLADPSLFLDEEKEESLT